MSDVLELTVGEWMAGTRGDCEAILERGWRVGISRGLIIPYDYDGSLREDLLFLEWRRWRHAQHTAPILEQRIGVLVEQWRSAVKESVRRYIRDTNERLAAELDEVNQLEVAFLGA